MSARGILLMAILVPSLPICFVRPFYGILLWTIISFTSLQWYTWSAYEIPWALLVAIPTLAGFFVFSRGWSRLASRETFLLAILWVWFAVTTIASTNTPLLAEHSQTTVEHLVFVSKILLMTFVAVGVIDSFRRLKILASVIAGCFGAFVVKTLPWLIVTGGNARIYGPEKSMISDNNDFGLALNMTAPLFFFLAKNESRPWVKRLYTFLFLITIPSIFFTYSRGALLGLVAIIAVLFLRSKQRVFFVPVLVAALILGVVFAPEAWRERMNPFREGAMDKSAWSRINAWKFSWNLANDFPVTGGGFSTFTVELFQRYAPNAEDVHGPHSIYFGILGEHGFVGLALFLSLIASCLATTERLVRLARRYEDPIALNYALMFQLSLIGFLSSGLFLGRQYFDYFYTIIACIVALKKLCFARWAHMNEPIMEAEPVPAQLAEGYLMPTGTEPGI